MGSSLSACAGGKNTECKSAYGLGTCCGTVTGALGATTLKCVPHMFKKWQTDSFVCTDTATPAAVPAGEQCTKDTDCATSSFFGDGKSLSAGKVNLCCGTVTAGTPAVTAKGICIPKYASDQTNSDGIALKCSVAQTFSFADKGPGVTGLPCTK